MGFSLQERDLVRQQIRHQRWMVNIRITEGVQTQV